MKKINWKQVKECIDDHEYMSAISRSKERANENGEVFTPSHIVIKMLKSIPAKDFAPGMATLEPACGDGQFVIGILAIKIMLGMSGNAAMKDIVGVDIMRDNVDLCRARCIRIAKKLGKKIDQEIVQKQILMGDFLNPGKSLKGGQTNEEYRLMREYFVPQTPKQIKAKQAEMEF